MNLSKLLPVALAGCMLSALVAAADGTLIRAADLKAKPLLDAATVKALAAETPLSVIGSDGGWSQVKTGDGAQGWVRMLNVRLKGNAEQSGNVVKNIAEVGNVARTGTTKGTATTGAKGLTKEEISNAVPNMAELKKMENYKSSPAASERFAKNAKLSRKDVPELTP